MTITARLQTLWAYNEWAWQETWPSLADLTAAQPEAYFAERPFFWGSLHALTVHSMAAESIWLARLQGHSPQQLPDPAAYPDFAAILSDWRPIQTRWRAYLSQLTAAAAQAPCHYKNTSGQPLTLLTADIVQHVVNHATEHRSQMTPVLYQLGAATRPLDYMRFCLQQNVA